jgi:nifR3 family TIM-barrel protein
MAGITDVVFRTMCKEHGADIVVSEMVSAEGIIRKSRNTGELLHFTPGERPVGIQLFGTDPARLARASAIVEQTCRPDFIDLNSGCPVRKVLSKNGGAALLRDITLFEKILFAMVGAVSIPVTVKIRSGWHTDQWVDIEFAQAAQACGVAAITVHPRSKTMGFTGHSFWERIGLVKQAVTIPVIGNGDIASPLDAIEMFKQTGCDSIMIGRGAMGNPWIFDQCKQALHNLPVAPVLSSTRLHTAIDHLNRFYALYGERRASTEGKKYTGWYIKGITGAAACRNAVNRSQNVKDMIAVLESFLQGAYPKEKS